MKKLLNVAFVFLILIWFVIGRLYGQEDQWTTLLDEDLSKWDNYLSYRHSESFNGKIPVDQQGNPVKPIGYNKDSLQVFSTDPSNGNPVLRISGEVYGCIFTKQSFENFHLKLKVKWGHKKWPPRLEKLKDSGILYHSNGPCGNDYWLSWMMSQEFQIMEGHMGDYWNIASTAADIRAFISEGSMNAVASSRQPFVPIGTNSPFGGFCLRESDRESTGDDWTELELICFHDRTLHIVNGEVVMVLKNSRYYEGMQSLGLTSGRIQLQSEGAEVFFKDIVIKSIDSFPNEYFSLFNE